MTKAYDNEMKIEFLSKSKNEAFAYIFLILSRVFHSAFLVSRCQTSNGVLACGCFS